MSRMVNMLFPEKMLEKIDEAAKREGRTRSEWLRQAARGRLAETAPRKDSSDLLLRLAARAVKGPNISERDIDPLLYSPDWRR